MNSEKLKKIESLYHAALELNETEREKFLREKCRGDAKLKAEVLSLLAFEKESENFIEKTAVEVAAKQLSENRAENFIGASFGHYKIESFLGAGGMGEVFCAVDERLERKVALKLLSPTLVSDAGYLRRFKREAHAASSLNHPNILTIFEIDCVGDTFFIATELIEGKSLRQCLSEKKLSLPEILKISLQIAEALEAAHRAGIVHRDIKPENIMIRPDGYVKVLDFGLAKSVRTLPVGNGESNLKSTLPGMIIGTIGYMSPEQVRGCKVDERTDIFSLGAVIYEMVSQCPPFAGETPSDRLAAILQNEPEPLAEFDSDVPPALEDIVKKALSKDLNNRYQNLSEMIEDLRALREQARYKDSSERFRAVSGRTFVSKLKFRNNYLGKRGIWLALAAFFLFFGIAAAYYFYAPEQTGEIDSVAVLPFVNAGGDGENEYLSDGLTESVIARLSQLSSVKVMSFNSVLRYKSKDLDARKIGRELNVEAILIGRIAQRGDEISVSTELVNVADNSRLWGYQSRGKTSDLLIVQETISREISEKLQLKLSGAEKNLLEKSYTKNAEAYQLYLKGRFFWNKRSAEDLRRGIEFFHQAIEKDPSYALAYAGLADSYGLLSNYTNMPPQESMPRAKAAALKALEIDDSLAEAHTSLGLVKKEYEWDFAGAENDFRRAIELNPNYATAHQWRAENLVTLKRFDEAVESMRRARELDPFSLIINGEVGWALHHARRFDEAVEQLQKTVELDRSFVRTHFFLGRVYEQKKMYGEAIAAASQAVEISGGNALFKSSLAHIYARAGQKAEAEKILRELENHAKTQYVSPFAFALIYAGTGENEKSLSWLEKAFDRRDTILFNYIRDPQLDDLRHEPRFAALLDRVGLEP